MPQIKDIAIIKTVAADGDFLVMQSPAGETYKIIKADLLQGLSSGGTSSSNSDNLFSNVVLLLSNNNSVLIDKSSLTNNLSTFGVSLSSLSKFSANSAYFAGGTNIITIPDRTEFSLGNTEFTIEGWINPSSLSSQPRYFISQAGNLSDNYNRQFALGIASDKIDWYWTTGGGNDDSFSFSCTPSLETWQHVAITREKKEVNGVMANTLRGFLNGILLGSVIHDVTYFNSTASLTIGSFGGYAANGYPQLSFIGNIEKNGLRLTKKCRYTDSFALPTQAFPTI